eukprot:s3272_g7.t1
MCQSETEWFGHSQDLEFQQDHKKYQTIRHVCLNEGWIHRKLALIVGKPTCGCDENQCSSTGVEYLSSSQSGLMWKDDGFPAEC